MNFSEQNEILYGSERNIILVLCIIGLVMLELTDVFFHKCILGLLYIGLGGYLIITIVLLASAMIENVPYQCEMMLLIAGWLINLIGGIMTLTRYGLGHSKSKWMYLTNTPLYNNYCELTLGITALILSAVMFADVIVVFATKNEDDGF